jgi:hypothetical protein
MNGRIIGVSAAALLAVACRTSETQSASGGTSSAEPSGQPSERTASGSQAGHDPLMQPGPAVKGHASDHVVTGAIDRVSAQGVSIVSDRGEIVDLAIVPETAITVEGREATQLELQEGQPVRASFNDLDGKEVAVEIQALASPQGAAGGTGTGRTMGESGTIGAPAGAPSR